MVMATLCQTRKARKCLHMSRGLRPTLHFASIYPAHRQQSGSASGLIPVCHNKSCRLPLLALTMSFAYASQAQDNNRR